MIFASQYRDAEKEIRMSPKQLIAQDVIDRLAKHQILPREGTYVEIEHGVRHGPLQPQLPHLKCEVCALGALFIAHVGLYNKFNALYDDDFYARRDTCERQLSDAFSPQEMDEIEEAFEAYKIGARSEVYEDDSRYDAWKARYEPLRDMTPTGRYPDLEGPDDRLVKICEHIIKYDTFNAEAYLNDHCPRHSDPATTA
jgi:hypothetical protein